MSDAATDLRLSAPATATPARILVDSPLAGVGLYCAALVLFVGMGIAAKSMAAIYPVEQVIWARYFFHVVFIVICFPLSLRTLFRTERRGLQVLRSVLVFGATACGFTSLTMMPMAQVSAIGYVAPLLVTVLSIFLLKEKVGPRRLAAVAIGFVGVLVILRPDRTDFSWWSLLPLVMASCYAMFLVLTRMIRGAASPINSLFYTAITGAVLATIPLPFIWQTPEPLHWLVFAGMGVIGGTGHFLMIRAFEKAEASMLAPFVYTELLWAIIAGALVFGDIPELSMVIGAIVIMGSGLFVLYRERMKSRQG
ncbi:MAG: DMT family transporter [Pseudomonadota bacterium]|nr:DMT family transporter [Pseudomonadota bacterium]